MSNVAAVLEIIHKHGPISRAEIASLVHLSPAAITNITGEFIARKLVFESKKVKNARVGRPAVLLELDYAHAYCAGIKLSNVGLTCAITDLGANTQHSFQQSLSSLGPQRVVSQIVDVLQTAASSFSFGAVGVSVPGIVAKDGKTVRHSPLLGWNRVPLGEMLEAELGLDVLVENDVNAMAAAEAWFGLGKGHDSFLVVTLGRGVGLGIILNGEIYTGPNGGAGEFGHVRIYPTGPETSSAETGTIEAFLSDEALLRAARQSLADLAPDVDLEKLTAQAREGVSELRAVFDRAGVILGRALNMLVNIFAPSLIILSGEGMRAADLLVPIARKTVAEASFGDLARNLDIVVDPWGDDAWARGAAGLAAKRYLRRIAHPGGD